MDSVVKINLVSFLEVCSKFVEVNIAEDKHRRFLSNFYNSNKMNQVNMLKTIFFFKYHYYRKYYVQKSGFYNITWLLVHTF